jgi:deazaflavin-dependent oxidoreductase (nitroreductase family)
MNTPRYVKAGRAGSIFNKAVEALTRCGVSLYGSRVLAVRGRKSGQWRTVPVNLLEYRGMHYLVAPRGETHWVRNLRANGEGELRVGRRTERFTATELSDDEKPPVLRAYLQKWRFEVKTFFDGIAADAAEPELRRIAQGYPVFRISIELRRQKNSDER